MTADPTAPTADGPGHQRPRTARPPRHRSPTPDPRAVTVGEIAEFLRHLAELRASGRGDDPDARAAFLARKAELFTRLAADPALRHAAGTRRAHPMSTPIHTTVIDARSSTTTR